MERQWNGLGRAVAVSVSNTDVHALEHGLMGRMLVEALRRGENGRRAYKMRRRVAREKDNRKCGHPDPVEFGSCDDLSGLSNTSDDCWMR